MQSFANITARFSIFLLICFIPVACTQKDMDPNDPADVFAEAREPYDDGLYDLAIQRLGEFKARFPYSKHAPLAELFIANSHFELGNFQEAAFSYEQFTTLHPRHEKVPFAMYRIGESYWVESPEEIDREQEYAMRAIEEWQKLVQRFPESEFAGEAKQRIQLGKRRIAESYDFIGRFYCKQELFHACAYKSIELLDRYPEFKDLRIKALERAARSFDKLAKQKQDKPDDDSNIYVKQMTAEQLREQAATYRKLASKDQ